MTWKRIMPCVFAILAMFFCTEFCKSQSTQVMTVTEAKTSITRAPAITSALSSDGGLPEITVSPLSTDEISTILSDLFKWEPARTRYSTYFLLLPQQQQIKQDEASKVWADPRKIGHYRPFNITGLPQGANPSIELAVHNHAGPWNPTNVWFMSTNDPFFRPASPSDQSDLGDLVFVNLSGFSAAYVPIPVANVVESYFIDGLVARLIVGNYAKAAGLHQSQLDFVKGNPPAFPNTFNSYEDIRSYIAPLPTATTYGDAYSRAVSALMSKVPVAPAAILLGWEAGEDLSHLSGLDEKFISDTWKLINQRFSTEQLGEMTAFTLTYLSGYFNNQRITAIAQGQNPAPVTDLAKIWTDRDENSASGQTSQILSGFSAAVVREFYFVAENAQAIPKSRLILAQDASFIVGLQAGAVKATNILFQDVFLLAYGLGQKDGYTEGYAAGEQDGYAKGYSDAYSTIQEMSNGGFWGTLGKVETAAGVVASAIYFGSLLLA